MLNKISLTAAVTISFLFGQMTNDFDFWEAITRNEKIAFIQGVYSGLSKSLQVMGKEASREKHLDPYWTPPFVHENSARNLQEYYSVAVGSDYGMIVDLLDVFYSNPDNIHIDIMSALHIIVLHQEGKTRRANELLLLKQRELLKGR